MTRTVALLSGGIDSTVALAQAVAAGDNVLALSADYGQTHYPELNAAAAVAEALAVHWRVANLTGYSALVSTAASALLDPYARLPRGGERQQATIVPNRNGLLLNAAAALAVATERDTVLFAPHLGDADTYPDCRPQYVATMGAALQLGAGVKLSAPFLRMSKAAVVKLGDDLDAPLHLTWSCYSGGNVQCGVCGACAARRAAFADAAVPDKTRYLA